MPDIKSAVLAILAASTVVALPTPQAATITTDVATLHLEVQCGCWNLCTLEALGDSSITGCDFSCDPQFLCETIDAQTSGPTTIVAATASPSAISKRAEPHSGIPPFNPFGPGGQFDPLEEIQPGKAKRTFDIRPIPGPTIPDPPFPEGPPKAKRAPERPVKPWPACQPGETDCPPIFEPAKRYPSPRLPISPITDPCPKGAICEDFVERDPDPRPPVEPNPCPFGPDCPPPEGHLKKRELEPKIPIRPDEVCPPGSICDPIPLTVPFAKREPDPQTLEFPDLDDTGRYPKHEIPPPIGSDDSGLGKRMIPWDLTIKGTCSGGGCGVEVGVTIHF